ncbi:uncharacterized protein L969DRAFT_50490 [Mixia osmundae IAM 14324]|uniref:uncharacterized protein n=1 Tax=Mixia osmundae (strain CBS 9802 / IAM 14324 / JCM 22182 / KY 12970) TaxID=764103 RepID=UPI0004A5537F|nr:uncharacterized protein L969DRAFT_50490 [Mixia osmundae IAM 14324]KEI38895.1 hypothetical protein L969DRAFT_50490 [Mixia osmundae IAM 14324]
MSLYPTSSAKAKRRTYTSGNTTSSYGNGPSQNNQQQQPQISDEQRAEIKEAFELFDLDKDGMLDYHEVKVAFRALGFDLKKAEVLKLLRDHDENGRSLMSFESFQRITTDKMLTRDPLDEIRRAFQLFDDDKTGKIDIRNLRRVAKEIGENLDDDELTAMIEEFDLDQDGMISEQEFVRL